ncbi:MAG: hypothetical protein ABIX28_03230, partial [Vicinamibacterales bacterium]
HPHQVKKLFRNCWIIGRRFRLAHVKFGTQTIEVATFRRQVDSTELTAEAEIAEALEAGADRPGPEIIPPTEPLEEERTYAEEATPEHRREPRAGDRLADRLIQRDNTYGTPEEDAFRRDFTVNALFYDIGTFSIIDYVGGLNDLEARLIRCIGDPNVRFLEDPVRMLRAVVLAARLEFTIDQPILDAMAVHRHEIAGSAPARLLEEYYKILRSGHAEQAMRQLRATKLMKEITPELSVAPDALWRSIAALDSYRARFQSAPDSLTNAILAGTLLQPLGLATRSTRFSADALERRVEIGMLPIARRDVERLQHIMSMQARLLDLNAPARAQRNLLHRSSLAEALTWLEIHGDRPDVVAHWRNLEAQGAPAPAQDHAADLPFRARRRRRGRRRSPFVAPQE